MSVAPVHRTINNKAMSCKHLVTVTETLKELTVSGSVC